ncbi:ribonuclease P protein component [Blattabacterium cuenoti]|uniref:ribonuclease P protein component n=1 Tax=Blattabacterium cuenoti TaxID=1653831 RepID=UPI003741FCD2
MRNRKTKFINKPCWNFSQKKNLKKSVHRNRIKRLLKASFILNKYILEKNMIKSCYIIFIYKAFYLPKFKDVNESIISILNKINHYWNN